MQARELVRIVSEDPGLAPRVRRRARRLALLRASNPDLVVEGLEKLRRDTVPSLSVSVPTCSYARLISVETYWRYNLDPATRRRFVTPEDYRSFVDTDPDPAQLLTAHLVSCFTSWFCLCVWVVG